MLNRLKKQSIQKLIIMLYNIFRMGIYNLFYYGKFKSSLIQNLHPSTKFQCKNGYIQLSNSVYTRRNVTFIADGGNLIIGTSFFNQGCIVTSMGNVKIGNDCLFGPNVVIVDHDHDYKMQDKRRGSKYKIKDVIIGNNVIVGANSVILKGAVIEDNAVIGAGSIVTGLIPRDTLFYTNKINSYININYYNDDII